MLIAKEVNEVAEFVRVYDTDTKKKSTIKILEFQEQLYKNMYNFKNVACLFDYIAVIDSNGRVIYKIEYINNKVRDKLLNRLITSIDVEDRYLIVDSVKYLRNEYKDRKELLSSYIKTYSIVNRLDKLEKDYIACVNSNDILKNGKIKKIYEVFTDELSKFIPEKLLTYDITKHFDSTDIVNLYYKEYAYCPEYYDKYCKLRRAIEVEIDKIDKNRIGSIDANICKTLALGKWGKRTIGSAKGNIKKGHIVDFSNYSGELCAKRSNFDFLHSGTRW